MTRTIRDWDIQGGTPATVQPQLLQWFSNNRFRIIDPASDGSLRTYDAPELVRNNGRIMGGHLRFMTPAGSVVGLNVAAAGGSTPTVFAVALTPGATGVHVHGEFFGPTSIESLGGPLELAMINTIWAPAGVQRKKAYVLVTSFESFVTSIAPLA